MSVSYRIADMIDTILSSRLTAYALVFFALFLAFCLLLVFKPIFSLAFSRASSLLSWSLLAFIAGVKGISSSRTPTPPTDAPRIRIRPSGSVSVITGDAAGRYLNSSEYLRFQDTLVSFCVLYCALNAGINLPTGINHLWLLAHSPSTEIDRKPTHRNDCNYQKHTLPPSRRWSVEFSLVPAQTFLVFFIVVARKMVNTRGKSGL